MLAPKKFYYIAHLDNLFNLLQKGIFSRTQMLKRQGWSTRWRSRFTGRSPLRGQIHAPDIIQSRKEKKINNHSLRHYANVYFQARNPMLYRVVRRFGHENVAVLEISPSILQLPDVVLTDGNAAVSNTQFFSSVDGGLKKIQAQQFNKEYWNESDKRPLMAECLVYSMIPKEYITAIYLANQDVAKRVRQRLGMGALNIIPNAKMFFLPEYKQQLTSNLSLAKGDMFFSDKQTFTVSVNTVGVMGKGLASRAKYQFPDVYVKYQDVCRGKQIAIGQPFLYKREDNFEQMLAEHSERPTENGHRWFLLFPTKTHWKNMSHLNEIEMGLQWLQKNYKILGIQSLALPALGCGLGGLSWQQVGPLMCRYLKPLSIDSCIYLPTEKNVPPEHLKPDFLLPTV